MLYKPFLRLISAPKGYNSEASNTVEQQHEKANWLGSEEPLLGPGLLSSLYVGKTMKLL